MLQQILVIIAFLAAISYMGFLVYKNFFSKDVHCPGCSGCTAVDFAEIEKKMEDKYSS